jgi:hypothetical protein
MDNINKANVRLWVDALRSGEFQQGTGALHNTETGGYCCLGVACEVAYRNGVPLRREDYEGAMSYNGDATALPLAVREWLGISDPSVQLADHTAIWWNDIYKADFAAIAGMLETEYLGGEKNVVDLPAL